MSEVKRITNAPATSLALAFGEAFGRLENDDLDRFWSFTWDESLSAGDNTYRFHDALDVYRVACRSWLTQRGTALEELSAQVRERFTNPKMQDFLITLREHLILDGSIRVGAKINADTAVNE